VISMPQYNTYRVNNLTPRVYTFCVESHVMKTIGERIRQAREAHKMSGEALAKKVGYKNQSAIGNLENRVGGTGGSKLGSIADALNVPLEWLMRGPDNDNIPFLPGNAYHGTEVNTTVRESGSSTNVVTIGTDSRPVAALDPWTLEAIEIMSKLKEHEKQGALANLRTYVYNLGPPRDGQALPMASQKNGAS